MSALHAPMNLPLERALTWLSQARGVNVTNVVLDRIHTDSRSLQAGDLFVALKGETFDGTAFLLQAQTQGGIVKLLVCDYRAGAVRGYCDFDSERLARLGANPSLAALFGEGYLAITFETEGRQRYQGIVPLVGDTLAEACESYFAQSEQIPTLIRVASRAGAGGRMAAGLLIQHLADGEEGRERLHVRLDHPDWEHVAVLAGTISHDELLDPDLSLEAIVWRLFHEEEPRVFDAQTVRFGCSCSEDKVRQAMSIYSAKDIKKMTTAEGKVTADCQFCSAHYELDPLTLGFEAKSV